MIEHYHFPPVTVEEYPGELTDLRMEIKALREAKDSLERERCELRKAVLNAREEGRESEWYFVTSSWLRNIGGKVLHKSHFIDALAVTTTRLRERHNKYEAALQVIAKPCECTCPIICECGANSEHTVNMQYLAKEALKHEK